MEKHAYLIAAHNEFSVLKKLVCLLDYKENDIYIHIDKKVNDFNKAKITGEVRNSKVYFVHSSNIQWGAYSQINYELILLKEASKQYHDYYHLLSGVDLPIKSHEEILNFFRINKGKEFIEFDTKALENKDFYYRIKYYHFFQEKIGKCTDFKGKLYKVLQKILIKLQQILRINRIRGMKTELYKGTNWFSITHDLAIYILESENMIKHTYRDTLCADEVFLHTIIMNSKFKSRIVNDCLRYIDWERGNPYTFTREDYKLLINSDKLWARKFSEVKDEKIVCDIYNTFKR